MKKIDGSPILSGETVTTDHVLTTFQVQVRSLRSIGADELKDIIQKRLEVTQIAQTDELVFVR